MSYASFFSTILSSKRNIQRRYEKSAVYLAFYRERIRMIFQTNSGVQFINTTCLWNTSIPYGLFFMCCLIILLPLYWTMCPSISLSQAPCPLKEPTISTRLCTNHLHFNTQPYPEYLWKSFIIIRKVNVAYTSPQSLSCNHTGYISYW